MGSLLFNVFFNDIFYFSHRGKLYNYADDNTLSFQSPNYDFMISVLQTESEVLIEWFFKHLMKANPDKFQAIAVGKKTHDKSPVFEIGNSKLACEEVMKLLDVDIDFNLSFDNYIQNICKKAGQQLNVLKRLGKKKKKKKTTTFVI